MKNGFSATAFIALYLFFCGQALASPMGPVREIACAPNNPSTAAILINTAIWLTMDGGKTWKQVAYLEADYFDIQEFDYETQPTLDLEQEEEFNASSREVSVEESSRIEVEQFAIQGDESQSPASNEEQAPAAASLAVYDNGTWAASLGDLLFLGNDKGIRRIARLTKIVGFVFDTAGSLWISHKDTLSVLKNPSDRASDLKKWRIHGALTPVLSRSDNVEILVPSIEGLFIITSSKSSQVFELNVLRIGNISAAIKAKDARRFYIASQNKLYSYCKDGPCPMDFPTPPAKVSRIKIDRKERVYIRTVNAKWFVLKSGSWHLIKFPGLEVDSLSRIWLGTELGPLGPDFEQAQLSPSLRLISTQELSAVRNNALENLFNMPGAPPACVQYRINPLPRAEVFFGLNQGFIKHFEKDAVLNDLLVTPAQEHKTSNVYMGITLIWFTGIEEPSDCYRRQREWKLMQSSRIEKAQALLREKQVIRNMQLGPGEIARAIEIVIQRERNDELIKALTENQQQ